MERLTSDVTVAGHICLDVIPAIRAAAGGLNDLLTPGKLVDVGPAITSTGGAVSNTGLALHRLGLRTKLMGKVGDDWFGRAIVDILNRHGDGLANGMIISPEEQSSYTVVINPPGVDRIFLHCTGTNDTFVSADVRMDEVSHSRLFHFGYPPLMKRMYEEDGRELAYLLAKVKKQGLTVTLDMAKPDPASPAGKVDWHRSLQGVLAHVDFFFPSFEELLFMIDRAEYERLESESQHRAKDMIDLATPELLGKMTEPLLGMGAAAIILKLGQHGLYVRTSSDAGRWSRMGRCRPSQFDGWLGREMLVPVFKVNVEGTTGAGDATIAGFIAGIVKGLSLEQCVTAAVAVGACNVERADATSGIVPWEQVQERISQGWDRRSVRLKLEDWNEDQASGSWIGPNDQRRG